MSLLPKWNDCCVKCGERWGRLVGIAVFGDLVGAHITGLQPEDCREGGDHEWPEEDREEDRMSLEKLR